MVARKKKKLLLNFVARPCLDGSHSKVPNDDDEQVRPNLLSSRASVDLMRSISSRQAGTGKLAHYGGSFRLIKTDSFSAGEIPRGN